MDIRVPFDELAATMERGLLARGFEPKRAAASARLFAEADLDGVRTHGAARYPRFCGMIAKGRVDPSAAPVLEQSFGAWERWNGRLGPGNLNAAASIDRAVQLARSNGMGLVALRNTNHWMRGGAYGLRAADQGCAAICWTNTMPNLPAWGAREAVLGNNPLIMAVPRRGGHVLLDAAMSQFSNGKLDAYASRGEPLPVDGGYDSEGRPSRNAAAILASKRALPIGFWKGSGLSLLLDLIAAILSGGATVPAIGRAGDEFGISQVFIAFDLARLDGAAVAATIEEGIRAIHEAAPAREGEPPRFPGERTQAIRAENLARGVAIEAPLWEEVRGLAGV